MDNFDKANEGLTDTEWFMIMEKLAKAENKSHQKKFQRNKIKKVNPVLYIAINALLPLSLLWIRKSIF